MSALTVRSTESPLAEINITPLIDVLLALMLIFMIAAPLVPRTLELPLGGREGGTPKIVELQLTATGEAIYNDRVIETAELRAQLLSWGGQPNKPTLQLRPDKATQHQQVISMLDMARASGVESIAIETPR